MRIKLLFIIRSLLLPILELDLKLQTKRHNHKTTKSLLKKQFCQRYHPNYKNEEQGQSPKFILWNVGQNLLTNERTNNSDQEKIRNIF